MAIERRRNCRQVNLENALEMTVSIFCQGRMLSSLLLVDDLAYGRNSDDDFSILEACEISVRS